MATKLKHNRATPNVKAACEDCRRRKTKCDGVRPICSQCAKRSRTCEYDAEPDEYRTATLKRKCMMFERQATEAQQFLFALRDSPELEAAALLRRLRAGESVQNILGSVPQSHPEQSERRIRSPSLTGSCSSTGGGDTSMAPPAAPIQRPPQAQIQLHQQGVPQTQNFTLPDRSRLAIDFLVNGDDDATTTASHHSPVEVNSSTATSSIHLPRMSSYPPTTPAAVEQDRRSSMPHANGGVPEVTMKEAIRPVQGSFTDWDNYYANVSSLFRNLGEPPLHPRS